MASIGIVAGGQNMTTGSDATPLIFAPEHSAALAQSVARSLGLDVAASEEREFDGGEHKMRPLVDVRGRDVFVIQSLAGDARASANDKLCRLLFFLGALKDAGAASTTACTPYLCYARKDRRTQPRDPVTTRYIAALIEAVGTRRVIVLDVHNDAAFDNAFRCETVRLAGGSVFAEPLTGLLDQGSLTVASPDVGGVKRAQALRELLAGLLDAAPEFAFMEKRRARGTVSGEALVGDVAGRDVVIHDDLIASGGTVLRATHAARAAGARRVLVAATHAVFAPDARRLFEPGGPDLVLVSDSIALTSTFQPWVGNTLRVCSAAPIIAAAIRDAAAAPG
jgi:ribose-phosphate pyrophosphokinase